MVSDFLVNLLECKMKGFIQHVKSSPFNPEFDAINLSYVFKLPSNPSIPGAQNVIRIDLYNIGDEFTMLVGHGTNFPNAEKLNGWDEVVFDKLSISVGADILYSNAIKTYDDKMRDMINHIISKL